MNETAFKEVTLLVTHRNRAKSLERLLKAFKSLNIVFGDIVVSDDASTPENLDEVTTLQGEYNFKLITTFVRHGLGNNINKGQDKVKTEYTLYVQDDFEPKRVFTRHL